ncbi:MAG: hypothetical protein QM731_08395 [Chitinophagaceae bacterium]
MDARPLTGMNYYRLKLLHPDGSFIISPFVSANLKEAGLSLEITPNPVKNKTIYVTCQLPDAVQVC